MKRIFWLAVIFLLLKPQAVSLGFSPGGPDSLIFPNGGFEINPTEPSNGWTWPSENWVWDGGISHSSTHSARVSRTGGSETASLYSAYLAVQPSTNYTLTFWMRTQDTTYWPSIFINQFTASSASTGIRLIAYANIGNGTSDWRAINYRFQTMPDAAQIRLRIYLYTSTTGTFWFDDFSLLQGGSALFPFQSGFPVTANGWVWLSSPSVADIDHNGMNELLIGAGNDINGWDKAGNQLAGYPLATGDRMIIAQIALDDLDLDGRMEIVAGTRTANPPEGQCRVFAWQDNGTLMSSWPKSVAWNTQYSNNDCLVTSIVLADIDHDQNKEILASTSNNASGNPGGNITPLNLYAWNTDGTLVNGNWPNGHTTAGFYGAIAAGDLNNDDVVDVIAPRDHHYVNAYSGAGVSMPNWPIQTYLYSNSGDYQTDLRIVYGRSAPVLADLDGNGTAEYIVVGNVDGPGNLTDILYNALLILNPDGTRRSGWEVPALSNSVLSQVDQPLVAPAIADLNGDGALEIVAATMDGWIRGYDVNKNVLWAFNYTQNATLFPSEPVIGDINGDGILEIIFGTYVPIQAGGNWDGPVGLWALNADGTVVPGFPLTIPTPGVRAAPTLADLDGDGKLDILAATITGQIFVWETPYDYYPEMLPWPTGRHDLQRTGSYLPLRPLDASTIYAAPSSANQGDIATYSIHLASTININETISLTDTIPSGISYIANTLTASSGVVTIDRGTIYWRGNFVNTFTVDITYQVRVDTGKPKLIGNTINVDTVFNGIMSRTGYLCANCSSVYLPLMNR